MNSLRNETGVEEWRTTPVKEGYEVSSLGRVRNRRTGRVLVLSHYGGQRKQGYLGTHLGRDTKVHIHVLVCLAFHGPRPPGLDAAHNNGNYFDNRATNLRWATRSENMQDAIRHGTYRCPERPKGSDHHKAKLTEDDVREIRRRVSAGASGRQIARELSMSQASISGIVTRRSWRHI